MTNITKFDFTNTEDWEFQGCLFHYWSDDEEYGEYAAMICDEIVHANSFTGDMYFERSTVLPLVNQSSRYFQKGTCDHCGAAFNYGAVYKNRTTENYAVIGHVCATSSLCLTSSEYQIKKLRTMAKRIRTRSKNDKIRKENLKTLETEIQKNDTDLYRWLSFDHAVCKNIRKYFINNGRISLAQRDLLQAVVEQEEKKPKTSERVPYKGFLGKEKQRLDIKVKVVHITSFYRDQYSGYGQELVYVTNMVTEDNILVVAMTPSWGHDLEKGQKLTIRATVKKHNNYNGDDQTVVQRVKVLN